MAKQILQRNTGKILRIAAETLLYQCEFLFQQRDIFTGKVRMSAPVIPQREGKIPRVRACPRIRLRRRLAEGLSDYRNQRQMEVKGNYPGPVGAWC